jgi:hypothetical protein
MKGRIVSDERMNDERESDWSAGVVRGLGRMWDSMGVCMYGCMG